MKFLDHLEHVALYVLFFVAIPVMAFSQASSASFNRQKLDKYLNKVSSG